MNRIRLLVFNAALGVLDYRLPEAMDAPLGSVVLAPLGPRKITGIVWEPERLETSEVSESKLRPILEVMPVPPLSSALRRLIEWTADYYCAPLSAVARMVISSGGALNGPTTMTEYRLVEGAETPRLTPQRKQALEQLTGEQATIRELATIAQVSEGVLRGMVGAGLVEPVEVAIDRPFPPPDPDHDVPDLSDDQAEVAARLVDAVEGDKFAPFLIDGVTGSGKTETYFEPMAAAVKAGKQVLVLLPEIALTENFLVRFEQRFGAPPILWHSSLKSTERRRAWRAIASGEAQVVVGARSALFLPYAKLGLIVVDEAHEVSFKQDDGVRYNARDVSVMRARFEGFPVVLASATPALESLAMAEAGTYEKLDLHSRFGGAQLPTIHTVDLTKEEPERGRWLARPLVDALEDRLAKGEQSLLFLNRRGFAPLTLCRNCGYRFQCPNCSAWLVEHRLSKRLACHHCGHEKAPPEACPDCGEPDCLVACGPGVERIADEVAEILPEARVMVATSDTLGSPERAAAFIAAAEEGAVDVIVGTQLVTKGFHFPELTLVGVVDADLGLEGGDLRAAERTYQQIAQVAGRAGRGAKPGEVLIQTRHADANVIAALANGDRDAFYAAETEARQSIGAPPFGRWAAIIISAEDDAEARSAANQLGDTRPDQEDIMVLGPAPAPLALLRGRYRYRFLINARRSANLQKVLRGWVNAQRLPPGVRVGIDIDPYSFV
jgi:primosomal protein N' (replication factor Y)